MFFDVFSCLCNQKGISKSRAAMEIGLSNSIVTKWKKTDATPEGATLKKIADYFGVSIDFMVGATPDSFLLVTQYQLAEAEKKYNAETDSVQKEKLACEIDILKESLEDQLLAIKLDGVAKENAEKEKPTAKSGGSENLSSVQIAIIELAKRLSPDKAEEVLNTILSLS